VVWVFNANSLTKDTEEIKPEGKTHIMVLITTVYG